MPIFKLRRGAHHSKLAPARCRSAASLVLHRQFFRGSLSFRNRLYYACNREQMLSDISSVTQPESCNWDIDASLPVLEVQTRARMPLALTLHIRQFGICRSARFAAIGQNITFPFVICLHYFLPNP